MLNKVSSGDIIELIDPEYHITKSLNIDKDITILSKKNQKANIVYSGIENTALFKLKPKGNLSLNNLEINGKNNNQLTFEPLKENMSSAYNLFINHTKIKGFKYVLKATKGSFSDSISFKNSIIKNCENGIILAAEKKGDYNAEIVTLENCEFDTVNQNVINYFRGGYDESTIGGILNVRANTFTNCGKKETSDVLLKTRGIVNVEINNNTFTNNPIKMIAILWGEKK